MCVQKIIWLLFILTQSSFTQNDIAKPPKAFVEQERELLFNNLDYDLFHARATNNVELQIVTLTEIIKQRMLFFGDNTDTYEQAVYVEKLIQENSHLKKVNAIKPEVNMLIGQLLKDQFNYDKSYDYFSKALQTSIEDSLYNIYRDASNYIGEIYHLKGQSKKALKHFKNNLNKNFPFDTSKRIDYIKRTNEFLSEFYLRNNQLDSTLYFARKSIYNKTSAQELSNRYRLMANAMLYLNKVKDSTLYYGIKALDLAESMGAESAEINAHYVLMKAYESTKNYKNTFYHSEKYYTLKEKQWSYENAIKIGTLNLKQEKENTQLKEILSTEKLSNQKTILWVTSIVIFLFIIILIFIVNRIKLIRKQNRFIEIEKQRAEQSEQYKEQFLANMSHEIRTPLHAISGMLNAIRRQDHPKYQNKYLDAMKVSADNLLVLLNDALDMSKIESGNLDISYEEMNPRKVVKHVLDVFELKVEEKGITLTTKISSDIPKTVMGDASRFYQILLNLIGNALKFTEKGRINLGLQNVNETIQVSVSDTGIGILPKQLNTIFEPFKQGENVGKAKYGGTGLGLAITKKLIELQNGKIWVTSKLNEGSTFYFELPLIKPTHNETITFLNSEKDLLEIGKKLKGISILIAEDNEFNLMVVEDDLRYFISDIKLEQATDGKAAIELFNKKGVDLILMDIQMPEINGHDATKRIREIEKDNRNKTPIIAMTASLLKSEIDKCYESGMDAFIPKPYKPHELIHTIYNVLKKINKTTQ